MTQDRDGTDIISLQRKFGLGYATACNLQSFLLSREQSIRAELEAKYEKAMSFAIERNQVVADKCAKIAELEGKVGGITSRCEELLVANDKWVNQCADLEAKISSARKVLEAGVNENMYLKAITEAIERLS